MRGYTRHQLKQDRFQEATKETFSWAVEHRQKLVNAGVVVAIAALLILGGWYWLSYQERQAQSGLSAALATYQAPVRPANLPPDPNIVSFTSPEERAKAANAQFRSVADKYSHNTSGKIARYFVGITDREMGDPAGAERELKQVSDAGSPDLASLAKLALAGMYRDSGKQKDAIALYNELIAKPTHTVAKATAQLELADLYAGTQPAEAKRLYEQIRKEAPASAAAEVAGGKLASLQ